MSFIMYLLIVILISVNLVHSKIINEINVTDPNLNYEKTLDLGARLYIRILKLNFLFYNDLCKANCVKESSESKSKLDLHCNVIKENALDHYINAAFEKSVTESFNGNWVCQFRLTQPQNKHNIFTVNFTFEINEPDFASSSENGSNWTYVWVAIGVTALLIIIGQAICIIRIWMKAKARTALANLRANRTRDSPDSTVRYTATPVQVKMDQHSKNLPRESGIYEALENVPISKPLPPPIETLPRSVKTESPKPSKNILEPSRKPTFNRLPPTAAKIFKDDTVSISSTDALKPRGFVPIGNEDPAEYEVMTPTNKPPVAKVNPMMKPGTPLQVVPNFTAGPSKVPVLPSMIAAAQLKPVNKNIRDRIESNTLTPINPVQTAFNSLPPPNRPRPPVKSKPPKPLPIQLQSIPTPDNQSESSDDEEWTYEPLHSYDDHNDNIYNNVPR